MSLTRTISRNIARSGQTAEQRYMMAVRAVNYREKYHGEHLERPDPRKFRAMNKKGWKRTVKDARKEQAKRERAEYLEAMKATKAKATKPTVIDRIKAAISRRKVQAK